MKLPKSGLLQFAFRKLNCNKYKNNLVAKKTLNYLSSGSINIRYMNHVHKYNTRKNMQYSAQAWCMSERLVIINERMNFTLDTFLETIVHEVNHAINLSIHTDSDSDDKYYPMKLEMIAYIAEYMFHNNMYTITRSKFKEIKNVCFADYRKFKGYEKYTKPIIYTAMDITRVMSNSIII